MAVDTDDLDTAFATTPGTGGRAGSLEKLPDGKYEFRIKEATLKIAGNNVIFLKKMAVVGGEQDGAEVETAIFLKSKDGRNEFGIEQTKKELRDLGFDVDEWTPEKNRPFTKELTKACSAMKGVQFHGIKKSKPKDDKPGESFHNLYLDKRSETDGKPKTFGPAEIEAAAKADADPF